MGARILVFNAGSSSLKYELFDGDDTVAEGSISGIGQANGHHRFAVNGEIRRDDPTACATHMDAVELVHHDLAAEPDLYRSLSGIGHRVVHGGPDLWEPTLIDHHVHETFAEYMDLAPLHNGPAIDVIAAAEEFFPSRPHVAAFDTSFHHDLPPAARTYALPADISRRFHVRRYGFHGISCEYLVGRVRELGIEPADKTIICHLGAGASVTAVLDGFSVETSMGFTPSEGLVMGTRSGDVDPGLLVYLQQNARLDAASTERMLDRESGLRALGGRSGDYLELEEAAATGDERAELALDTFAHRVRKYLGAYWAILGGVDLIVFAGGIGEHSAAARERIMAPLAEVGWRLDPEANRDGPAERRLSPADARPSIWVIATRETLHIAREVRQVLGLRPLIP